MEDTPGNVQPDLNAGRSPKTARRSPRWTLLFVRDDGRTVPIKRFKGMLYLGFGVLLLALGTAGGLYWGYRQIVRENRHLASEVGRLHEEISALRYDKDVLTARLVLTEAQLKKQKPPQPATQSESAGEEKTRTGPDEGDAAAVGQQSKAEPTPTPTPSARVEEPPAPAVPAPPAEKAASEGEEVSGPVRVDDLAVAHEQEASLLRVTFLIRKDDPQQENVSGYAFVVLKPKGETGTADWIPMPWAAIESGRPSPAKRGQFFSIARFKPMKFEIKGISDPDRIAQLTVYVFDTRGELILQQDFQFPKSDEDGGERA